MTTSHPVPIFDGHNDVLLRLFRRGGADASKSFLDGEGKGQLDLPMAQQGGFAGGLFAMFVPSPQSPPAAADASTRPADSETRMPASVELAPAQRAVFTMLALLLRIERESQGRLRICRSVADIEQALKDGVLAPVAHIEGAEAIDADFDALDVLYAAGL